MRLKSKSTDLRILASGSTGSTGRTGSTGSTGGILLLGIDPGLDPPEFLPLDRRQEGELVVAVVAEAAVKKAKC